MTKKIPNPFDDFPPDGSPVLFHERMELALASLEPRVDKSELDYEMLLGNCNYYNRLLSDPALLPHDETSLQAALKEIVRRQQLIVHLFNKIRGSILAAQAIAQSHSQSKTQSERASKPRIPSLDERTRKRIAKRYWDCKRDGTVYGLVKELAREYEVTPTTIQTIVRKHKPDSIDK